MAILGKRKYPWSRMSAHKRIRISRIPRYGRGLRRYAKYLGRIKRKKRMLRKQLKKYRSKRRLKKEQRKYKTVVKQVLPSKFEGELNYVIANNDTLPTFKKYEIGAKEIFSECSKLPEEFKNKWNSYFYHRLHKLTWKIDKIQGWIYIERERGQGNDKQYFVEHYKLHEVPIIFHRDKIGGPTGLGQTPNPESHYMKTRCFTNCHQKYWGSVTWRKKSQLKWNTGDFDTWKNTSIFNHQKDNNLYNSEYGLNYWMAAGKDIIPPKWKALDPRSTLKIVISFEQTEYATFIHKGRKTNTGNACTT